MPHVQKVLDAPHVAGLTANPRKRSPAYGETEYLGYTIGRGIIKPQDTKLKAIQDWPSPVSRREVKSFVGLPNYYVCFAPNVSNLIAPITDLTTKRQSQMVKWSQRAEKAEGLVFPPSSGSPRLQQGVCCSGRRLRGGSWGSTLPGTERGGELHPLRYFNISCQFITIFHPVGIYFASTSWRLLSNHILYIAYCSL